MPHQAIIAFANDNKSSLVHLERETKVIYEYLNRLGPAIVNPTRMPHVNLTDLFHEALNRGPELAIFHFSGHAGDMRLLFGEGQQVFGKGIASMLKKVPDMQLAFLNGCATFDLIDAFHSAGVKIVIASSTRVYDKMAAEFAILFYASLCQFSTITEAFDFARAYLQAAGRKDLAGKGEGRHISTTASREAFKEDFPYGIYYADHSVIEQPDWKLGVAIVSEETDYDPAVLLLECIGKKGALLLDILGKEEATEAIQVEMNEYGMLNNHYNAFRNNGSNILKPEGLPEMITQMLPQPLGILIRQIVASATEIASKKNTVYPELLKYLLRFYDVMVKLSCFTMLSDLFEIIHEKAGLLPPSLKFNSKVKLKIGALLAIDGNKEVDFNYRELIKDMRKMIVLNSANPFVREYGSEEFPSAVSTDVAYGIIKWKKVHFAAKKIKDNYANHCKVVEQELCNIFDEVYYILRYNLFVVRNVEAIRIRFKPERKGFHHWALQLRLGKTSAFELHESKELEYTENYSVILVRGMAKLTHYLSLAPFIIDKGVLIGGQSQLYYYSHMKGEAIVYESVEDSTGLMEIQIREEPEQSWVPGRYEDEPGELPVRKWIAGHSTKTIRKQVPYLETLPKGAISVEKDKVIVRMENIFDQFVYFKKCISEFKFIEENGNG